MQHKRILIVSYYFAPQNLIGAVRPTKLAKYLARMGHEVTVICGTGLDGQTDPTLQRDLEELRDVHIIQEWNPLRQLKQQKAPIVDISPIKEVVDLKIGQIANENKLFANSINDKILSLERAMKELSEQNNKNYVDMMEKFNASITLTTF